MYKVESGKSIYKIYMKGIYNIYPVFILSMSNLLTFIQAFCTGTFICVLFLDNTACQLSIFFASQDFILKFLN